MKVLKILEDVKLVIADIEVSLGDKKQNSPTLCAQIDGKIIPLSSANDGRPIFMNVENAIDK
tara:strand:- start:270 stop:455 length:186 start_codon:yes stop_codon:yes gene_type:complete